MLEIRPPIWFALAASVALALILPACEGLKMPQPGRGLQEMPGAKTGFLTAKAVALRHAMTHMPEEEKRYGDAFYVASGIQDADPEHVRVLVAALEGMDPPVVEASKFYLRGENSRWMDGKPAIAWTARVSRAGEGLRVFVVLGWMHSNLIYQQFEYETRYLKDEDAWEVVDYKALDTPGT